MYAFIIAGGRGERLKPITDSRPKSMAPINGTPVLEHQVRWMRSQGVTDVVFLTGYRAEAIRDHFGDGAKFGVRAHYSHETTPLGRGGAVRQGFRMVPKNEDPVLVTNGDNITNLDLSQLQTIHRDRDALATLMLTRYPNQFGVVHVDDRDMVEEFAEKRPLPLWINAGVYLFSRSLECLLPEHGDHETETFPELADRRRLAALRSDAFWLTVDSAKDLREAGELLAAQHP